MLLATAGTDGDVEKCLPHSPPTGHFPTSPWKTRSVSHSPFCQSDRAVEAAGLWKSAPPPAPLHSPTSLGNPFPQPTPLPGISTAPTPSTTTREGDRRKRSGVGPCSKSVKSVRSLSEPQTTGTWVGRGGLLKKRKKLEKGWGGGSCRRTARGERRSRATQGETPTVDLRRIMCY